MKWLKRELLYLTRYAGRYSVRRLLRRIFNFFMCCLLVTNLTLVSYADVPEPEAGEAASASEASFVPPVVADPLADLTDEELEAYYMTFYDYPTSLLDWPEQLPQPYFVTASIGAAALYVMKLLLAAVGVYFAAESVDHIYSIFQGYEQNLRLRGDSGLLETWESILVASWGAVLVGMNAIYKDFKAYCQENVSGYGTEDPTFTVSGGYADALKVGKIYHSNTGSTIKISSASAPVYCYVSFYPHEDDAYSPEVYKYLVSTAPFAYSSSASKYGDHYLGYNCPNCTPEQFDILSSDPTVIVLPNNTSFSDFKTIVSSSDFDIGKRLLDVTIAPAITWMEVVQNSYAAADEVALPAEADAGTAEDDLSEKLSAASTAAAVLAALEGVWNLGSSAGEEEEEQSYPWMPDISKLFGGISDQLTELGDWISSIPDALAGIRDNILSIPGQITDFFTIDTAVISAAFADIQAAFADRFSGITQLQAVFTQSRSFDDSIPVLTVAIPEELRVMFGGETELVYLDLRPFADHFAKVRPYLIAMIYVAFAFWLLDEFDVKFHIG